MDDGMARCVVKEGGGGKPVQWRDVWAGWGCAAGRGAGHEVGCGVSFEGGFLEAVEPGRWDAGVAPVFAAKRLEECCPVAAGAGR